MTQADVPEQQLRVADRRHVCFDAAFALESGEDLPLTMEDLSAFGARARIGVPLEPGTLGRLLLAKGEPIPALVVWRQGDRHGLRFLRALSTARLLKDIVPQPSPMPSKGGRWGWLRRLWRLDR